MEVIKTYLDNVFAGFAQTEQVRTLKAEMFASMEEKYHALIDEGKSTHEAAYSVIANFGSIDEIAHELGLDTNQTEMEEEDSMFLTREEVRAYISQTKKSGIFIGLGAWLILCGVAAFFLSGLFALFAAIAISIPLFIVNGLKLEQYEMYEKRVIRLDASTKIEMEQRRTRYRKRFAAQLSCGVVFLILSVGLFLWDGRTFANNAGLELLLVMMGFGIFLIIPTAMLFSVYDVVLNVGDYANKGKYSRSTRLIGTIAAVYWPLVVTGYLLWSFLSGDWHISWIVWPAAGALFGALAGGIGAWAGMQGK